MARTWSPLKRSGFYRWLWEMLEPLVSDRLVLADAAQAQALAAPADENRS